MLSNVTNNRQECSDGLTDKFTHWQTKKIIPKFPLTSGWWFFLWFWGAVRLSGVIMSAIMTPFLNGLLLWAWSWLFSFWLLLESREKQIVHIFKMYPKYPWYLYLAVRCSTMTWANADPDICRHKASLGHNQSLNNGNTAVFYQVINSWFQIDRITLHNDIITSWFLNARLQ